MLAYIKFSDWNQNCQTTKLNHRQMYCVYGNKQLWSNYLSIVNVQPHNFFVPSPSQVVLECICVDFKGLLNGVNLILIVHYVCKLLSVNKISKHKWLIICNKAVIITAWLILSNKAVTNTWLILRVYNKGKEREYPTLTIPCTNVLCKVHAVNYRVLSFCINTFRAMNDLMIGVNSFIVLCV